MKVIPLIMMLILTTGLVMAAGEAKGAGDGAGEKPGDTPVPTLYGEGKNVETQNQGEDQQLQVKTTAGEMKGAPENVEAIRAQMQEQKQTMAQEMEGLGKKEQKVYQNQNQVREAVQAMKMLGEMQGMGPEISGIAQGFDNSVQATIQAELKMETRSGFKKLFAGGDHEAAKAIEGEVQQNQARIQEMKQVQESCQCGSEEKAMLQEQIQTMEQEQTRLQERANEELSKKGLFGWMWK